MHLILMKPYGISWTKRLRIRTDGGVASSSNRRGLVNEIVILQGFHHEYGKVHAAHDVALEDGVAHVLAPHRQTLALAFFEVAPARDRPSRIAGKHPPARFHLVVDDPGGMTVSTPSQPATAFLITSRSFVAPGMTAMRPLNASSLPTLRSRQTPTTS